MAVKSMAYDHPAYQAVYALSLGTIAAGSGAASARFVAHAAVMLKSVNYATTITATGTSIDIKRLLINRNGTATTTTVVATNTAVYTVGNIALTAGTGVQMAKGDTAYVTKGTDGTETDDISIEYVIIPGADVSN